MTDATASDAADADVRVTEALARLRERGARVTVSRQAVISALAASPDPLDVDRLHDEVVRRAAGINLSTVYRTVETLVGLGLVSHVHLAHGTTVYGLDDASAPHAEVHLQCRICRVIVDVPEAFFGRTRQRVRDESGFDLDLGHVALSGTCADCSAGAR